MAYGYKSRKYKRKTPYKGKSKKRMDRTYPNTHSFKFMQLPTFINSAQGNNGGLVGAPIAGGGIAMGGATRNNYGYFALSGAFTFGLAACPQYAAQAALFDRVKVNKIKVRIIPQCNVSDTTASGLIPVMRVVMDYDDAGIPTLGSVWARRGKEYRMDKEHSITFVPRVNYQFTAANNASTPGLIHKCPWMNTAAANNVPLYGMKFAMRDFYGSANNGNKIAFEITYYLTFKEQLNVNATPFGNQLDYGVSLQSDEVIQCNEIDSSGNIYDSSHNLIYVPDASGNEQPYIPPS